MLTSQTITLSMEYSKTRKKKGLGCRTAKILHKGFKDYYNFIRIHQELGTTPAQMAGIDALTGQNRWIELLRKSKKE